jgi:putative transposase
MTYDPKKHHRRSIRLQGFDYAKDGFYFITICVQDRKHLFGHVSQGKMHLNPLGQAAHQCWEDIPKHYPDVVLHEFVIMPNHVHGILQLKSGNDFTCDEYARHEFQKVIPRSVGSIVRGYKIGVTKWYLNEGGGSGVRDHFDDPRGDGGAHGPNDGSHGPNVDSIVVESQGQKIFCPCRQRRGRQIQCSIPNNSARQHPPPRATTRPIPHLAS